MEYRMLTFGKHDNNYRTIFFDLCKKYIMHITENISDHRVENTDDFELEYSFHLDINMRTISRCDHGYLLYNRVWAYKLGQATPPIFSMQVQDFSHFSNDNVPFFLNRCGVFGKIDAILLMLDCQSNNAEQMYLKSLKDIDTHFSPEQRKHVGVVFDRCPLNDAALRIKIHQITSFTYIPSFFFCFKDLSQANADNVALHFASNKEEMQKLLNWSIRMPPLIIYKTSFEVHWNVYLRANEANETGNLIIP